MTTPPILDDLGIRSPDDERRACLRYRAALRIAFRVVDDPADRAGSARVRDLSSLGIGLLLSRPVATQALIEIELRSAKSLLVRPMLARAVFVEQESSDTWLAGCTFT